MSDENLSSAPAPNSNPCRAIVLMILHLHEQGYELLRLCPRLSNSGVHWMAWITSIDQVSASHGAIASPQAYVTALKSFSDATGGVRNSIALYVSPQESRYFGWEDATQDSPSRLAAKFVERFPAIAKRSRGADPVYAAWYRTMVEASEPNGFPSIHASSPETSEANPDGLFLLGDSRSKSVALPPVGQWKAR